MTAINTRGISVAAYVMNFCNLNEKQFDGLDKLIKEAMRDNFMLERQSSDERLYSKRQVGGLRSLKYVYGDTKVRVARYMANASSPWIKKSMDE